jgi:hypothetical protein
MWGYGERCVRGSYSEVAATCVISCCDSLEEVALRFKILGDVSSEADTW